MEDTKIQLANKERVQFLYDSIFNKRQFEKLPEYISENYTNPLGNIGADAFKQPMVALTNAFPDAHWIVEEIVADKNKVVVKQIFTGTQKNQFQNIKPSNHKVSVAGIAIYEIENKKIIKSQVLTDRLAFFQQLGILSSDPGTYSNQEEDINTIYYIDKWTLPKASREEFLKQMSAVNTFIKTQPGYIRGEIFEKDAPGSNTEILTIAAWESEEKLKMAIIAMHNEFERINFNQEAFFNRFNIKMESGHYTTPR